jgi:hypothetical protein
MSASDRIETKSVDTKKSVVEKKESRLVFARKLKIVVVARSVERIEIERLV